MVINRKERFATEGIRFQRHNPDGTIPTPLRFLGFANRIDLSKFNNAQMIIKVDSERAETKTITFAGVSDITRITVNEAVNALNAAGFTDIKFSVDSKTGRLKGSYGAGSFAEIEITFENDSNAPLTIAIGNYLLMVGDVPFNCIVSSPITIAGAGTRSLTFVSSIVGTIDELPEANEIIDNVSFQPTIPNGLIATVTSVIDGENPKTGAKKIQIIGQLAAALDFGQGIKHGGNGLEIISFFDDETISIGLPKDIKEKEEIDQEGAKGTITRMLIGASLQGISPVVTLKEKDYYLIELIQGGKLNREEGTYDPPLSDETESPSFYAEMFSPVYSKGSNKINDVAGYEKLLFRSVIGKEGDVPAEAKAWAQYAFNLNATEYTDETGKKFTAWQEGTLTPEEFDALKVKEIKVA